MGSEKRDTNTSWIEEVIKKHEVLPLHFTRLKLEDNPTGVNFPQPGSSTDYTSANTIVPFHHNPGKEGKNIFGKPMVGKVKCRDDLRGNSLSRSSQPGCSSSRSTRAEAIHSYGHGASFRGGDRKKKNQFAQMPPGKSFTLGSNALGSGSAVKHHEVPELENLRVTTESEDGPDSSLILDSDGDEEESDSRAGHAVSFNLPPTSFSEVRKSERPRLNVESGEPSTTSGLNACPPSAVSRHVETITRNVKNLRLSRELKSRVDVNQRGSTTAWQNNSRANRTAPEAVQPRAHGSTSRQGESSRNSGLNMQASGRPQRAAAVRWCSDRESRPARERLRMKYMIEQLARGRSTARFNGRGVPGEARARQTCVLFIRSQTPQELTERLNVRSGTSSKILSENEKALRWAVRRNYMFNLFKRFNKV